MEQITFLLSLSLELREGTQRTTVLPSAVVAESEQSSLLIAVVRNDEATVPAREPCILHLPLDSSSCPMFIFTCGARCYGNRHLGTPLMGLIPGSQFP